MNRSLTISAPVSQGACGALFSVVPFVSKRALGLVCGFVGAGGNTGSAITQVRPAHRRPLGRAHVPLSSIPAAAAIALSDRATAAAKRPDCSIAQNRTLL